MNTQIAGSSSEQGKVAENINRKIGDINSVAREVATAAQGTQDASQQLAGLAQELEQMVGQFKISR
jgi:methyl-accepting chemotaxis protein